MPHGGYANGQRINYLIHIDNQTMSDIDSYTVKFSQNMTFTAHTPHHKTRSVKKELYRDTFQESCLRLSKRIFKGDFVIDATAPSTEVDSIVNVNYMLKVTLHVSGCNTDKDLMVRVVIGTIPIRESLLLTPTAPVNEGYPLIAVTPTAPQLMENENENSNDLPPSYKDLGKYFSVHL